MSAASLEPIWSTDALPFTMAVSSTPHNPAGFPDCLPFGLGLEPATGVLVQMPNPRVEELLERAYATGSLLGTAMDDTPLGVRYADDFLQFVHEAAGRPPAGSSSLEIGAGRGYLVSKLQALGVDAVGLEPGVANEPHWKRHGANVIPSAFPSTEAQGPFDLILAFALLEHIAAPRSFLAAVREHLAPGGRLIVSVPNCTAHIAVGDPSMLLHEHWLYFTEPSLRALLETSGFEVTHQRLSWAAGSLYCAAVPSGAREATPPDVGALETARSFARNCRHLRDSLAARINELATRRQRLGVFCPWRALALLPTSARFRFFDDDPELRGKYFPPFDAPVESRAALLDDPPDELWILSRSFGAEIHAGLAAQDALRDTRLRGMEDLVAGV